MTTPTLQFFLFGELQILLENRPISLPPRRTHPLLAALLLKPNLQSRQRLAMQLFPDLPEAVGRKRLSNLIWILRKQLPSVNLEVSSRHVGILSDSRIVDVEQFLHLTQEKSADSALNALDLYKGDLLPDFYDEWLVDTRQQLYTQFVRFLHSTVKRLTNGQLSDRYLPLLERLHQEDPYDESALRTLMRFYATMGKRGKSLALYDAYVPLAAAELNVAPSAETQALADKIRELEVVAEPVANQDNYSPAHWLRRARIALNHADFVTFEQMLSQLQRYNHAYKLEVKLMRFERAIQEENYDQAARIIRDCDPQDANILRCRAELALRDEVDYGKAYDLATQALMQAHKLRDKSAELQTLRLLAEIQQGRGEAAQAFRLVERLASFAAQSDDPYEQMRLNLTCGMILHRRNRFDDAMTYFEKVVDSARKHQYGNMLADVLGRVGVLYSETGSLVDAKRLYEQVLALWRDTSLPNREACHLYNYSLLNLQLGLNADALRRAEQARNIYLRIEDQFGIGTCDLARAYVLMHRGGSALREAIAVINNDALPAFVASNSRRWQGSAYEALARCHWHLDQYEEALQAARQSQTLFEAVGELDLWPSAKVFEALALLGLGDVDAAYRKSNRILMASLQDGLIKEDAPDVYYGHALISLARGEEDEARDYIERAYEGLLSEAEQLKDEPARNVIFRRSPMVRLLMKDVYARGIAQPPAGTVSRKLQAAKGNGRVLVEWTVDGGSADIALERRDGATALRRTRVSRLLRQAEEQNAVPTIADLAAVLQVSTRTIRRDMAQLAQ